MAADEQRSTRDSLTMDMDDLAIEIASGCVPGTMDGAWVITDSRPSFFFGGQFVVTTTVPMLAASAAASLQYYYRVCCTMLYCLGLITTVQRSTRDADRTIACRSIR